MLGIYRVLIFDDEPLVAHTIALMAEHIGMEAKSVSDAREFFEAVRDWQPTHIILDLVMPEMDGVEVLQELAEQGCAASIAISSGVGSRVLSAAHRSATEHGLVIAGVLPKPLSMASLQAFFVASRDPAPTPPAALWTKPSSDEAITKEDLDQAISKRQFHLAFQPKIEVATGSLQGFEALIRWRHPDKGMIMPERFIALSERIGRIGSITEQVIEMALTAYSEMDAFAGLSVSINISAKTLGNRQFPDDLETACRRTGISTGRVILEVTETAATDDSLMALDMFTRLRMKGFSLSIDDYGIGNSSLALLARLPFSEVKVDRAFAMTANQSEESRAIIKSTIDLGHSLRLCVVTEGVENRDTLEFLNEIGCDYAQGYYISPPMEAADAASWVLRRKGSNLHTLM